jgi:hypothetical protein
MDNITTERFGNFVDSWSNGYDYYQARAGQLPLKPLIK